ncbi:MAG: hypothetical protein QGH70_13130 [Nitrospinota bacterium]|nr:hypothetical protein [Nitrospinota bacterium]
MDFLGSFIGRELGPASKGGGAGPGWLAEALGRHRDRLELERIVLFGNQGAEQAESDAASLKTAGAEIHGMLASGRAGVRDPATGHLVV